MIDIRLPNITGSTEREQLVQMKSYLHQLAEQLQWALQNVDTSNNAPVVMPTARSLAPSSGNVSGEINAQATFASIKSLIIKSAEIVDAYYDEINEKLIGEYEALSDFGAFREYTEAEFKKTSTSFEQTYTNVQTLQSTVGDIDTTLYDAKAGLQENLNALSGAVSAQETALQDVKDGAEKSIADVQNSVDGLSGDIDDVKDDVDKKTKALDEAIKATNVVVATVTGTIKTGELYKDEMGLPVFGLEIGQRNTIDDVETFNKYARFVSNRLSFYDSGGYEVAYISDSKLYITHAEITSSFKLGGFVDTVMADGRVVTKWVGGNS